MPTYLDRALRSSDPRYARILLRLGYGRRDMHATPVVDPRTDSADLRKGGSPNQPPNDELTMLRAEYERVIGRRPFHGWDSATLRERIAKAQALKP